MNLVGNQLTHRLSHSLFPEARLIFNRNNYTKKYNRSFSF